ncbi:CWF19-like protein 1 [Lepeophtheirus salmonis]|uniref:CWF19-like protein 1 n=1 Tax=Lepeophtheirus salmonis TaxID=72036 RepID=A0A7R8H9I8_LEPSM|nr:CWF19-like protein 1 [Lepeophtheirus salmonis]CAF2941980.1 CWF19-like protein 1 [Lepeophtheirus salmonis]
MSEKRMKLLASGDIKGKWGPFLKRVEAVHKKAGPFELVLVSGSAFDKESHPDETWDSILAGNTKVPIPVYILGPNDKEENRYFDSPSGSELAENVIYIGKSGCYTTNEGLKIAYLSGTENPNEPFSFSEKEFRQIEAKINWEDPGFKGVDILLTSEWPRGVTNGGPSVKGIYSEETGSKIISRVAVHSMPRYHFSALLGKHYERPPYRNHRVLAEKTKHVTRFVSLAPVGNTQKEKWLYAFNIIPLSKLTNEELTQQPEYASDIPYKMSHLIQDEENNGGSQFFFDMNAAKQMNAKSERKKRKQHDNRNSFGTKNPRGELKDSCWFCLSGSEVEKHLVVSVGEHSYLALPKGGLVPDHVLILPIAHHASSLDLPQEVGDEIQKFKNALKECYHMQLQCVPIPDNLNDKVIDAFLEAKEICGVELMRIPPHATLAQMVESGKSFFYVETFNGERLFHGIRAGFNLNFGRDVLGSPSILDLPERIDWRKCKVEVKEETELASSFRKSFSKFDFTLLDDDED